MMDSKKFSIKRLSSASGVPPQTIRTWERRYSIFEPERDHNDQRIYSELDIQKAMYISELIKLGHNISKLAPLDITELQTMHTRLVDEEEMKWASQGLDKIYNSIKTYKIDEITNELERLRFSCGVKDYILKIILPIMSEIGKRVQLNKLSVTQEHIISSIVRDQLAKIQLPNNIKKNKVYALATPDGNLHELPIILANILCQYNQLKAYYLGTSHPAICLSDAISALSIDTIVLGAISSSKWDYKKNIIPYLQEIDKLIDKEVEIIIGGGQAFNIPDFENIKKITFMKDFNQFNEYIANSL